MRVFPAHLQTSHFCSDIRSRANMQLHVMLLFFSARPRATRRMFASPHEVERSSQGSAEKGTDEEPRAERGCGERARDPAERAHPQRCVQSDETSLPQPACLLQSSALPPTRARSLARSRGLALCSLTVCFFFFFPPRRCCFLKGQS